MPWYPSGISPRRSRGLQNYVASRRTLDRLILQDETRNHEGLAIVSIQGGTPCTQQMPEEARKEGGRGMTLTLGHANL